MLVLGSIYHVPKEPCGVRGWLPGSGKMAIFGVNGFRRRSGRSMLRGRERGRGREVYVWYGMVEVCEGAPDSGRERLGPHR